jgi:hypothetical protein
MEATKDSVPKLRVLEFYSGIGGMHYSLKLAQQGNKATSYINI